MHEDEELGILVVGFFILVSILTDIRRDQILMSPEESIETRKEDKVKKRAQEKTEVPSEE